MIRRHLQDRVARDKGARVFIGIHFEG
jgi:hypothetical protein